MYIYGFFQTDVLIKFFIPFRPAKAIARKNFNWWRIYNTAGIPGKTGQNFILANQDHAIAT